MIKCHELFFFCRVLLVASTAKFRCTVFSSIVQNLFANDLPVDWLKLLAPFSYQKLDQST